MENFIPEKCSKCKKNLNTIKNGKIVYLRCLCEWERGFHERLKKTVHVDFLKPIKTINDWDPPVLHGGYEEFMAIQKSLAIRRIYEFAFEEYSSKPNYALAKNIIHNNNLFIRGPNGSGRGLLSATIKILAAIRDISCTSIPCDFDLFKIDLSDSEIFGNSGENAKIRLYEKYECPEICIIENMRAEQKIKFNDKYKKFRGANSFDGLLAKRMSKPGILLITSSDFIGEIMESLGDRLLEVLSLDKTKLILLLSPQESILLKDALRNRKKYIISRINPLFNENQDKKLTGEKRLLERMTEETQLSFVEEALFFEETFKIPPTPGMPVMSIQKLFAAGINVWSNPEKIMPIWENFCSMKEKKGIDYIDGIKKAKKDVVRSCKELSEKMTEKELLEIGSMLSMSCKLSCNDDKIKEFLEKTKSITKLMS